MERSLTPLLGDGPLQTTKRGLFASPQEKLRTVRGELSNRKILAGLDCSTSPGRCMRRHTTPLGCSACNGANAIDSDCQRRLGRDGGDSRAEAR